MTTSLFTRSTLKGNVPDLDESLRETLEYFIPELIRDPNTQYVDIDPAKAYRYKGDFFGLLQELVDFPEELHWIAMRMIGLDSPMDFDGELTKLMLPEISKYQRIINIARTQRRR